MSAITFISNGDTIVGNLYVAAKPQKPAFLFVHGWLGHQNVDAAQALAKLGHTSMTYAMRGHGTSGGDITKLTRSDFLNDAVMAYDFLQAHIGNDAAISLVGSSFGCYLSILLTKQRNVQSLSLRVPANYPDDSFHKPEPTSLATRKGLYDDWRRQPLQATQNRALKVLSQFNGLVQIIESENDDQVPHQTVMNYVKTIKDSRKLSYTIMKGAPHSLSDPSLQTVYGKLLCDWVQQ